MRDKLKSVKILGQQVEIRVSSNGVFSARMGPDHFESESLKQLEALLRKAAGKQRVSVSIPATLLDPILTSGIGFYRKHSHASAVDVTIVGLDTREHRAVKIKYDGTSKSDSHEQWSISRQGTLCNRMSKDDMDLYVRLKKDKQAAYEAYERFVNKWKIEDPVKLVQAAINAKADEPNEESSIEEDGDPR